MTRAEDAGGDAPGVLSALPNLRRQPLILAVTFACVRHAPLQSRSARCAADLSIRHFVSSWLDQASKAYGSESTPFSFRGSAMSQLCMEWG
mmetsp:Transcript_123834/g.246380  ORF Transcript_123834/g.246380 Transcript_123834/m.246380 type:complete len:91 (-) Transcript_123834:62-334(-)